MHTRNVGAYIYVRKVCFKHDKFCAGDESNQSPPSAPPSQDKKDFDLTKLDLGVTLKADSAAGIQAERASGPEPGSFEPLFPSFSSPVARDVGTPGERQQEIDFFRVEPDREIPFMEQGTHEAELQTPQDLHLFPKPSSGLGKRLFADMDIDLEETAPALESDTKRQKVGRASPKMKLDFLDALGCDKGAESEERVAWTEAGVQPETSPERKQSVLKRLNMPNSNFAAFEKQETNELGQARGSCSISPARLPTSEKVELQSVPQADAQPREPPEALSADFQVTEGGEELLFGESEHKFRSTDEILKRLVPKRVLEEGEDVPQKRPRRTLKEAPFCLDLNAAFTCDTSFFETEDFGGKKEAAASLSSKPAESAAAAKHEAPEGPFPPETDADVDPKESDGENVEDALPEWAGACEESAPIQQQQVEQSVEVESGAQRPKRPRSAASAGSSSQGPDLDATRLQEESGKKEERLLCSVPTQTEAAKETTSLARGKAACAERKKDQTAEVEEASKVTAGDSRDEGESDRSTPSQAAASPVRKAAQSPLQEAEKKQEDRAPCKQCSPQPEGANESGSGTGDIADGEGREGREDAAEEGEGRDGRGKRGKDRPPPLMEGAEPGDLEEVRAGDSSRASFAAGKGPGERECEVCSRDGKQPAARGAPTVRLEVQGDRPWSDEEAADSGEDVTVTAAKALCLLK